MHITEKRIEIEAPVERVFDFFSDFESFPRWMKNIKEVRYTGRRFTKWAAEAPLGTEVEWEAETTHFEPDRRIAWRSVRGDIDTKGEVVFEETRRGTTLMRVVLGYALPAGRLGDMIARLFGKNPERQLEDDLERFAAVVEGRRRSSARRDRDEDARDADERRRRDSRADISGPRDRGSRPLRDDDEQRVYNQRQRRERDYYADGRREHEDDAHYRERERRAEFDEALRAAQRSQAEGRRRYEAERRERERDDEYRYAGERAERQQWEDRRPRHDERWEETRRREPEMHDEERDDSRPRPPRRHALTPRERETEGGRRDPDYGYSEQAFRRGVDKLMDEPPSRRWRRWD